MASLEMNGSYDLTKAAIESNVTKKAAGNYALGHLERKADGSKSFIVEYVGRSDTDVAGETHAASWRGLQAVQILLCVIAKGCI